MTPEELIEDFRASLPYALDEFQLDAIRALAGGHSVLVAAPTGSGKTVIGEFGVFMARNKGLRAIYTTPIKALSNQKFRDFRARFGDDEVGLLTGDVVVNRDAPICVMTTEVLRNLLVTGESRVARDRAQPATPQAESSQGGLARPTEVLRNILVTGGSRRGASTEADLAGRASPPGADGSAPPRAPMDRAHVLGDVGAVIFDEVHYMGDAERGTAWEESILLTPSDVPLVCLSATVPNAADIAEWIREAHGDLTCIFHDERSVPLEHRYWLPDADPRKGYAVHTVLTPDGQRVGPRTLDRVGGELAGRVRWGGATSGGFRGDDDAGRDERPIRELPEPWQVVRYLEGEQLTPAIYFVFSRRATEEAASSCLALRPVPQATALVTEAKARLADLSPEDRGLRQVALLFRLLPRGVAVHHAGLLPQIKMLVEELFQAGKLRAVFATDTLALGINMPARTVVVAEMQKFDGVERRLLTPNEYRQMTGRAGRRGIDERGVSLVLYSPWITFSQALRVMSGELLPLESAFRPTYSTAMNLWQRPGDAERLADLYARSLRRFQHDRDLHDLTERKQQLEDAFERLKATAGQERRTLSEHAQELARADHALRQARRAATLAARQTVEGLGDVLTRYDYLRSGRPTHKAPYLRGLFDTNALTLCELLLNRQLEDLAPHELAEALSWFSTDRDALVRGLPLTRPLHRLREALDHLHGGVLREEERHGLQISRPLPPDFHGIALAWTEGDSLADLARRSRVQEGDLVGALQKTLDLVGQLRSAALRGPLGEPLVALLGEADRLLRRGVVEASYTWAVRGPPEDDESADPERLDWAVPVLYEDEPGGRRPGRGPGRGRAAQDRRLAGSAPRRGAAARQARKAKLQARLAARPPAAPRPRRRR